MISYLIGIIGILLGGLFYANNRRKSAEALVDNQKTKEEVQKIQAKQDVNNAKLSVEEEIRKKAHDDAANQADKPLTDSELAEWFKNRS